MRVPARQNKSRAPVVHTASVPAPVGGLNARDLLAAMDETDAVIMDNFFPLPSKVILRKGFINHVIGFTGIVESLCAYSSPSVRQLFAANTGSIFDVTSGGTVGSPVQTGLTNNRWQHANFGTPGGAFLIMVNGQDKLRLYDGLVWKAIDGTSTPAITGVSTSLLVHVNAHKARLWFIETASLRAWFLPILSIGGAASLFDMTSFFVKGGFLMAMATWTLDSGTGPDDLAVFISSEGEVVLFKGIDPAFAATWELVGIFHIGAPIGRRCFLKYQTELLLITQNGIFPITKGMATGGAESASAFTEKVGQFMTDSVISHGAKFGWEIEQFPKIDMLLLNIPTSPSTSEQLVMNVLTNSWARFTGWNAVCWELFNNEPFFGGDRVIGKAWEGTSDSGPTNSGSKWGTMIWGIDTWALSEVRNIVGEVLPAFSSFGKGTQLKHIKAVRPVLSIDSITSGLLLGVNVDYDLDPPEGLPSFTATRQARWGSMIWGVDRWAAGVKISQDWQGANVVGYVAAMHLKVASNSANISWIAADYVYEKGGIIG